MPSTHHADSGPPQVRLELALHYSLGLGERAAYFAALVEGRALASTCPDCGLAWCPPRPVCPHDGRPTTWSPLSGTGTLVAATRCEGRLPFGTARAEHVFGLVRLDGAQNTMLGRLGVPLASARPGLRLKLSAPPEAVPHPAQAAWFVAVEE